MKTWTHKNETYFTGVCDMCNSITDSKQWVNINGTRRKMPAHKIFNGSEIYVTNIDDNGGDGFHFMISDSKGNEHDLGNINAQMQRPGSPYHLILKRDADGVLGVHWAHYRAYIDRIYSNTKNADLFFSRIKVSKGHKKIDGKYSEIFEYLGKAPKGMTHKQTTTKQGEAA